MALTDVGAGTKIEDTGGSTSQWIRLADEGGNGFAESYPLSPSYDHTSIKYNAKGERVAYLKGDIVKAQAHWASPGSYFFLKAQNDVPRGIDLEVFVRRRSCRSNRVFRLCRIRSLQWGNMLMTNP